MMKKCMCKLFVACTAYCHRLSATELDAVLLETKQLGDPLLGSCNELNVTQSLFTEEEELELESRCVLLSCLFILNSSVALVMMKKSRIELIFLAMSVLRNAIYKRMLQNYQIFRYGHFSAKSLYNNIITVQYS